jgi:hypothetical protein
MLEILDLARRPIAGEDDLFAGFVQGVEGVKEFLLDAFLAGQELDVVDEDHIALAEAAAEFDELVVLDRLDEFVGEFFLWLVTYWPIAWSRWVLPRPTPP